MTLGSDDAADRFDRFPGTLVWVIPVLAIAYVGAWRGGLFEALLHNTLALVGMLTVFWLIYREIRPPSSSVQPRFLVLLASLFAAVMITNG